MKDIAIQTASRAGDRKLNVLREYLQNYILFLMQKTGMSPSLYFVGGTALRFLYGIRRYSEYLDFTAAEDWDPLKFSAYITKIKKELDRAGYSCRLAVKEERTVQKGMIRFAELLFEVGLSPRKEQILSIHIEIDTNPPRGWRGEKSIVDIHLPVLLQHYDRPSLYAAKLTALFGRSYTKGRDVYDVFWFRSRWRELRPNYELWNNGLAPNEPTTDATRIDEANWLKTLKARLEKLNWKEVENDVKPFLEDPDDLVTFTKENLLLLASE